MPSHASKVTAIGVIMKEREWEKVEKREKLKVLSHKNGISTEFLGACQPIRRVQKCSLRLQTSLLSAKIFRPKTFHRTGSILVFFLGALFFVGTFFTVWFSFQVEKFSVFRWKKSDFPLESNFWKVFFVRTLRFFVGNLFSRNDFSLGLFFYKRKSVLSFFLENGDR